MNVTFHLTIAKQICLETRYTKIFEFMIPSLLHIAKIMNISRI